MRLLLDTDIFCKLGVAGLLPAAAEALGVTVGECARLPALPHMLRRGSLVKRYGEAHCAALGAIVSFLPVVEDASDRWLTPLVSVPDVDAGEAQLLALVAEHPDLLLTGDKRSLRAAARVQGLPAAIAGRIVTLEAILVEVCRRNGIDAVRTAVAPLIALQPPDRTLAICFSPSNADPIRALLSYLRCLEDEVAPVILWQPTE
ncbi:MAG: hypothetical protein Q8P41_25600 [Pseudomonadota bacterium]|nr:hypothetical protein [Pseudomonadota bacterium]